MVKGKNSVYAPILVIMLVIASFSVGRLSVQVKTVKDGNKVGVEETNSGEEPAVKGLKIAVAELKTMAMSFGVVKHMFGSHLPARTVLAGEGYFLFSWGG